MPRKGTTGTRRKAPGTAVDPRNGQKIELTAGAVPDTYFPPPISLSTDVKDQWEAFWKDPVAQLITPADKGMLVRYFEAVDRQARLLGQAEDEPWIRGSTGQRQANPFFALAMTHEKAIQEMQALEQQLGIAPKKRAALGSAVITERRSLDALNAENERETDDDDEDPRVTILRGETEES